MIAIADYGMGNRRSVEKALAHVGAESVITADHDEIRRAAAIILPGVGAFPEAMRHLDRSGLGERPDRARRRRRPAARDLPRHAAAVRVHDRARGRARGSGILPGAVTALESPRLPHIGWNLVTFERESTLTEGLGEAAAFYHVHSFACRPSDPSDVVGTSEYGERFVSVVERENVMAAQFHPEKSSKDGLRMLRNFATLAAVAVA